MVRFAIVCLLSGWSLVCVGGCGGDDSPGDHDANVEEGGHDGEPAGPPSGAKCPDGSTLTYKNFADGFFSSYCRSCHSAKVKGTARMMAPDDHNFDTLEEIELLAEHIDQVAAAGPSNTNQKMPPATAKAKPSDDDRRKLGEWLACELPE